MKPRLPAAEVCFETWTAHLPAGNVLCYILDLAAPETLCCRISYVRLFLKTPYGYRREGRYELHAFVLMPEHIHLLLTPAPDVTLERTIQLIKGGYSHALGTLIGRRGEVWQRGFTDHRIRDLQNFTHHRDYIHQNPVARKIVNDPGEYRYCSAFPGFKLDAWSSAAKAEICGNTAFGTSGTRALPGSHE